MATKYTFDAFDSAPVPTKKKHHHHRRQPSGTSENEGDNDPMDGNGSLTYSAASSINSAAGESTDSSLAGIMRVLDVNDSKELAAVLEKERIKKHQSVGGGDRSVTAESYNSLAYSTDAESHMRSLATEQSGLAGTRYLGTIAGQTSDQYEYDGGNYNSSVGDHDGDAENLIFAPAEHTDSIDKKRKDKRKQKKQLDTQTPRVKNSKKQPPSPAAMYPTESLQQQQQQQHNSNHHHHSSSGPHAVSPSDSAARPPKGRGGQNFEMAEEEDIWYAKWWMFCFPDTVKTMTPKR